MERKYYSMKAITTTKLFLKINFFFLSLEVSCPADAKNCYYYRSGKDKYCVYKWLRVNCKHMCGLCDGKSLRSHCMVS